MAKVKYKAIPDEAIIDIQVSGSFYARLVELLAALGASVEQDKFKAAIEALKTADPPKELFEFNVQLVMLLIYEIEKKAVEQNKMKDMEIDIPDEKKETT